MANILQPTHGSRANINLFLESVEDKDMYGLLLGQLNNILVAGRLEASDKDALPSREQVFSAVKALIAARLQEDQE